MRRVVVIGAGAAGTMAAIFAAEAGAETLLLERTRDGGRKILISGGGRCNILPSHLDESRFVTDSSRHTLRKMLRSWPLREQIAFFERDVQIPLKEESESAKLFPVSDRARDVRDGLLTLARSKGVRIQFMTTVTGVTPGESRWQIACDGMPAIDADAVVLATGGLSVPNTGSDGTGLRIADALGHAITPPYAALTPLIAQPTPFAVLSGISLPVTITARSSANGRTASATGGFLFTHTGYSGPAVLDVSHVAVRSAGGPPARITVQWTTRDEAAWVEALRPRGARTVVNVLRADLPNRVADAFVQTAGIRPDLALAHLTRQQRVILIETLTRGPLPWTGDEGYKKAEVTGGGVELGEIDPATFESRRHRGLFLCGEMLDAFGPIGGYNFYWAWATGRAAGRGAAGVMDGLRSQ
jgi:predicted Rossmann fold flavoprotein